MKPGLRTYYFIPAVVVIALFLLAGSFFVRYFEPKAESNKPYEDMVTVYLAMAYQEEPPENLTTEAIRNIITSLEPELGGIADKISISSYEKQEHQRYYDSETVYSFTLEASHASSPDKTYRISTYGFQ